MPETTLPPMPRPKEMRPALTSNERRDLERAELKIASGLKAFLEVGLALKEIRDHKLYRQDYETFEEYCTGRWDFSRQRGYELLGASEVVTDLSAIADICVLPVNEAQARPLTLLRAPSHRRRAWKLALRIAPKAGRPVTARDTGEAVRRLNGKVRHQPVDGVPVFDTAKGLRVAYADAPYPGMARSRYQCDEVNYQDLIERLTLWKPWVHCQTNFIPVVRVHG